MVLVDEKYYRRALKSVDKEQQFVALVKKFDRLTQEIKRLEKTKDVTWDKALSIRNKALKTFRQNCQHKMKEYIKYSRRHYDGDVSSPESIHERCEICGTDKYVRSLYY